MSADQETVAKRSGEMAAEAATKAILMVLLSYKDSLKPAKEVLLGLLGESSEIVSPDLVNSVQEQLASNFQDEPEREIVSEAFESGIRLNLSMLEEIEKILPSEDSDPHEGISRLLRNTDFVSRRG
ncbi:MAG: hypothetical protein OXK78_04295 [Caldilineaceae bacterium]|nr:hypothetical protein [Caldilineaceae bacterium]